jgi:hypothetical protein
LSEVICHAIVPINAEDTATFSTSTYTSAPLYVPEESIEAYRTSSYCWSKFQSIKPISNVNAPDSVKTLQEYLNTLPADGTEQTVNLDDYEPITEPITIPARLHVTITGSKKLTIGKAFQGDYLFETERQAYLSFQVPDIVWEEGTTLPSIIFHAAGAGSEIHLDGAEGDQIACTGTLIQVEDSAFVQVSTDIGGDVVRANPGGCIYIDKPNSSLDSYIKEIYLGEGRDFEIFGNIHFDAMTVSDTMYWNGRGTLDLPEKIDLGPQSRIGLCADALSLSTVEFVMTEVPEERGYITMTTLGKGVDATKLRCTVPEGYSPRMTETAGANTTTQVVSIERVDADFNASFEALMQYLYQNLQTYADSLQDADSRINTLSDANLKDSLQTEVTYLGTLRTELYAAYNTLAQQHNLYYGARSVENQYSYLQDCLTKMNVLQEQLLMMNYVINEQIALEQLDDLQDFINNVTKNDTIGTADNPVIIELPDSCSFSDITIHKDVYIVIRPSNRGGRPVVPLRPTPGKPAIKVEEGGHLTFEDLDIVCDHSGGGTQYVYVEGSLIVDENVTFTSATDEDVVVYVASKGKSEWSGDLPQGRVENHGGFVQRAGIIDVYYNYGSHIIEGGQVHYVLNYEEFSSTAGTIGSTDSTSTRPAIVNYGTMHLEGGTVTGYGPTLIVHYHILYLDGVTLDDSHVEHTIEAHADFYTRGDIPFRHIELAQDVTVYILSSWTVIWHIHFIDGQLPVRRAIFASPGDYIPSNFREYIDCPLPAHYRWYCDDLQRAVEVRDEKVHDEDDLQAFIDGLSEDPGTTEEPRLLDGENSIVPWSEIPMMEVKRHLHVQNITFTIPAEQATPCVWTIPSGSSVRLTQVTFEGGKRFSEREEHYLSVSGQLILGQTQFRHCHVLAYTPIYLSESLTDTLYLCLFDPKGALYEGAPAILPYADYTLTEADASRVVYPDQEEWGYRLGSQGTIELAPASSSALSDVQLSDVHIYVDAAGRLQVSGMSDNTPCRIFTIEGQLRYSGPLSGAANLSLDHGCYLLQVGDIVSKVVR